MADYKIEDIYQGGYSSLSPEYGNLFSGYRVKDTASIGLSTDPRTANVLQDVSTKLNPGEKVIEVSLIQPEVLEAIPKQHLEELNRLAELTGVDLTVHGPLIDASGTGERGFNEQQREVAERKILSAVEKSHQINPKGNVPVTFHTANQLPGTRYTKPEKGEEYVDFMPIVNQETGEISAIKKDERYHLQPAIDSKTGKLLQPGESEKSIVEEELEIRNNSEWNNSLRSIEFQRENAERIMSEIHPTIIKQFARLSSGQIKEEDLSYDERSEIRRVHSAAEYVKQAKMGIDNAFNTAYKVASEKQKKLLNGLAEGY